MMSNATERKYEKEKYARDLDSCTQLHAFDVGHIGTSVCVSACVAFAILVLLWRFFSR